MRTQFRIPLSISPSHKIWTTGTAGDVVLTAAVFHNARKYHDFSLVGGWPLVAPQHDPLKI